MKDWIPLFQALVWPVFLILLLIIFREQAQSIIQIIKDRINKGAGFSLGPAGLTISSAPKLEDESKELSKKPLESINPEELLAIFSLNHMAQFARILPDGKNDYSITVWLESNNSNFIKNVTKVIYHLHSSYKPRDIRESNTLNNNFLLKFYAWGQFNLHAEVYLKNQESPLVLNRYINF